MAELDTMVGFSDFKKEIRALATTLSIQKEQAGKAVIGAPAKHWMINNSENTVYSIKNLVERR